MTAIERIDGWLQNPWELKQKPFHVMKNLYFVGTSWVSVFLLKTEKGLVLIDCAMRETMYQLVDNIRAMGFDPHEIKYLLLSHGHFDHCGAARYVQEMSGCETWIGQDDAFFFTERRDLISHEESVSTFKIDHYYNYDSVLNFGDVQIKPVHCPGHTPGTTSMFITMQHEGKPVVCAMHGGLGALVLSKEQMTKLHLPMETRQVYLQSIDRVLDAHVDVLIPSHVGHAKPYGYDFYALAEKNDGTGNVFIDTNAWRRMLEGKRQEMVEMLAREAAEQDG